MRIAVRPLVSFVSVVAGEKGVALVVAMMALVLMSALGLALVATTSTETLIAANYRLSVELLYAAEGMARRAMVDLRQAPDWTSVLTGAARSTFVDGAASGTRVLADGTAVDLDAVVNLANCNRRTACSAAAMDAVTAARPWGVNNPRWRLYSHGPLGHLLSGSLPSSRYVVALVADDPSERDGDPLADAPDGEPGAGVLWLRAEAFGPRGAHRTLDVTLAHEPATPVMQVISWRP